jgi:hypothetical protein
MAVMVGIGFDGLAADLFSHFQHIPKKSLLYQDDTQENIECKAPGHGMGSANKFNGMPADPDGRGHQEKRDDDGGQGFSLAMPVGVLVVGRFLRDPETDPQEAGTENVRGAFGGVGDKRIRMTDMASRHLDENEDETNADAKHGGAHSPDGRVYICSLHGRCLYQGIRLRHKCKNITQRSGIKIYRFFGHPRLPLPRKK